jgi:hypothetical protein
VKKDIYADYLLNLHTTDEKLQPSRAGVLNKAAEETPGEGPVARTTKEDFNNLNRLIPEDKKESDDDTSISCNGCEKWFKYWVKDESLHMSITCLNLDLCKDC